VPYYFRDQAQIDKHRAENIKELANIYREFGQRLVAKFEPLLHYRMDCVTRELVDNTVALEQEMLRASCLHAYGIKGSLVMPRYDQYTITLVFHEEVVAVLLQDTELDKAAADLADAKRRLVAFNAGQYLGRSILKRELRNLLKLTIDYDIWSAQTRYQFYLTNGRYVWHDESNRRAKHRQRVARLEYLRAKILRDSRKK